jgi:hypothetical protein
MAHMRSYGQFCSVAKALDVLGERWALLVLREIVLGPKRYTDLLAGLPGVGTNVLATRLRELETAGLITYMRTDSVAMAAGAVREARGVIAERYGEQLLPRRPNVYRTKTRGAQEAHEAIRPSSFARTPDSLRSSLKPDEYRLYELIWRRAIASQMAPARFELVGVDVAAGRYLLHAGASKRVFDGYQAVYVEGRDDEEDERLTVLPELREGEPLSLADLLAEQHFTQPPPRYTEATLIRALEEHGIGRPSTYAPTLDTIRQRGYISLNERRLVPEESAYRVTDLLIEHFPEIVDLAFTARMEEQLDEVARGEVAWVPIVRGFYMGPKVSDDAYRAWAEGAIERLGLHHEDRHRGRIRPSENERPHPPLQPALRGHQAFPAHIGDQDLGQHDRPVLLLVDLKEGDQGPAHSKGRAVQGVK